MTNITPLDFDPNRRDPDRRLHLRGVPDDRAQRYQGIGSEFAAARTQAGMDVAQVAVALRIRKEHLAAIEDGRFTDLPAPAYALGFVRSYADYLGLDPAAAGEAFKQETSTSRRRTPLVFPTAEPVERVPRGWLLGMSALLVAVVFGAWYYSERTGLALLDRVATPPADAGAQAAATAPAAANNGLSVVDVRAANAGTPPRVEAVPPPAPAAQPTAALDPAIGRVLGVLPAAPAAQTPPQAATPAVPPPTRPAPTPATTVTAPAAAPTPPAALAATPAPAPVTPAPAAPVVAAVEAPPVALPVVPAPEPEVALAEPALSPTAAPAGEPVAVVEELPAFAPAPALAPEPIVTPPAILAPPVAVAAAEIPAVAPIVPPAAPVDVTVAAREGQVFGATSGRVVILAHQDSWVQITGAAGELLLTRILRAGDKYIAPAREDIVLMTGNAGALEVTVDGKVIPALGPAGTVRRNVSLSADRLLAGTAVQP